MGTISLSPSSLESSASPHLTEKSPRIQQNPADQSPSPNKRLRRTIEEGSKDVENTESFGEINIEFNDFESCKRLGPDEDSDGEDSDGEDLVTRDIPVIEDQ